MSLLRLLVATALCAPAACSTTPSRVASSNPRETPLPAPIQVCASGDAGRRPGLATPTRAGVYDPRGPVDPSLLNWTVPGIGCVTYPGPDRPREACAPGGAALPVVDRVLCAQ